jgi:hypothetical protein
MAENLKSRKTSSLVIIALAGLVLLAVLAAIKILMEPQIIVRDEPPPDPARHRRSQRHPSNRRRPSSITTSWNRMKPCNPS